MRNYRNRKVECGCFNCKKSKRVGDEDYPTTEEFYCRSNSPEPDINENRKEWCCWIVARLVEGGGICDDYEREEGEKKFEWLSRKGVR